MRITDLTITLARRAVAPRSILSGVVRSNIDVLVLQVRTDEGITGQSMVYCGQSGVPAAHFYAEIMRPFLVGRDPARIEAIWQEMLVLDRFHAFMQINYPGPIDVALWDIAGQRAGLPLWQMLGGYRDRIPCYESSPFYPEIDDYVAHALRAREMGFKAFKLHPPRAARREVEACTAVREAVGDSMVLMSDPVAAYDHREALWVGRHLERLDYYWFEEPLADTDIHGYIELCRALDIPIAGVEFLSGGVFTTAEYIVRRAVDIVRSDVSWKGGFTGFRKTAALAEAFGLKCEIHLTVVPLLQVANLHAACAIKNCDYHEVAGAEGETWGLKHTFALDADGCMAAPSGPGLGVDVDWDVIDNATVLRL
jgi:L-alanine-DL-glutamate epimerase-like enolase superfamily enzyme